MGVWLTIACYLITFSPSAALFCRFVAKDPLRIILFVLGGLNKITRRGAASIAPGVSDLHNARHMLAMVCGLGMGVMAALLLTMNVFAEFAGPGTIGLPRAMRFWDSCHKVNKGLFWALPAIVATATHASASALVRIVGTILLAISRPCSQPNFAYFWVVYFTVTVSLEQHRSQFLTMSSVLRCFQAFGPSMFRFITGPMMNLNIDALKA
ncbi:Aph-1 protein [Ancylostoma ceylanicum]|uniref:Aph-1 protein n=1 Tax=Ancylostoma ceylanicum TaxID=53326 RepID=A0A0D6LRL2_9BILA|nr:Aph-1 protein [Ancylostoma ceylanicum]